MAEGHSNGTKERDVDFYAGYTRFEVELEFVQSLSNPDYLQYLAGQKYFESTEFVNYLKYLQYFQEPKYLRYLQYPGPTLRALELLQEERFRKDILVPFVVDEMKRQMSEAAITGRGA